MMLRYTSLLNYDEREKAELLVLDVEILLASCRFPITASSSHCFNKKWFVELLVLRLVTIGYLPPQAGQAFSLLLRRFCFPPLSSVFDASSDWFLMLWKRDGGLGLGEEVGWSFALPLSFTPDSRPFRNGSRLFLLFLLQNAINLR